MSRLVLWLSAVSLAACGGVSEERVSALEAQVTQMKTGPADAAKVDALAERVATLESSANDSMKKMEGVVEVVQGELARMSSAPAAAPAAAAHDGDVWLTVSSLFGIPESGVTSEGDTFTVKRAWLAHELQMLAASGRAPKLAGSKKGVAIRGVKPKTLPALLGLENNDVITAIGDKAVVEPNEIVAALRAANGSAVIKLTRKKDELVLTYKLVD